MSATLRGWFASRLSIGRARKVLILQKCTGGFEWIGSRWFDFKGDKSTVKLGKDKEQFIYPSDFAFHQKNVDVYMKLVDDGAPIDVVGTPIERRAGVYPDPFGVHLWGAQRVVKDLLSTAMSANWIWIVVGVVVGAAVMAAVLLGLIQTGVFNPKIVQPAGSPVPLVLP